MKYSGGLATPDFGPELTRFRQEMKDWIKNFMPKELNTLVDWYEGSTILAGSNRQVQSEALNSSQYQEWEKILVSNGLVFPHWPKSVGGLDWSEAKMAIFAEECHRAGVPRVQRGFSADLIGTALLMHGTAEQKQRFLPRIVSGEDRYCQGFSEPNHGSDLAAVETSGVVDGEELVITGQKVWTSQFDEANMMFVLCCTDPVAPKYERLSFVIVPCSPENNIEIRPIRQISGAAEFAESFLDGARAPLVNVVGGLGKGWAVAQTTLAKERTRDALVSYLGYEDEFWRLVTLAQERGCNADQLIRQRLVQAYTRTQIMRYQALDSLARVATGVKPGSHVYASKLLWSEYHKVLGELGMDIGGPAAVKRPVNHDTPDNYTTDEWQDVFLCSRGATIFSGTSEIQRNIIAERVLKLPREPKLVPPAMDES